MPLSARRSGCDVALPYRSSWTGSALGQQSGLPDNCGHRAAAVGMLLCNAVSSLSPLFTSRGLLVTQCHSYRASLSSVTAGTVTTSGAIGAIVIGAAGACASACACSATRARRGFGTIVAGCHDFLWSRCMAT